MRTLAADLALVMVFVLALGHRARSWRIWRALPGAYALWVLAACFLAASLIGPPLFGMRRQVALGLVDYTIVAAMLPIWQLTDCQRSRWIALIGFGKLSARLIYTSGSYTAHSAYQVDPSAFHTAFTYGINIAFAVQVLTAGGVFDGVGRRIADLARSLRSRGAGLLAHVAA